MHHLMCLTIKYLLKIPKNKTCKLLSINCFFSQNLYDDVADDVSIVISSDDDLTDVTSNDEESSTYTAVKRSSKRSQKDKKTKPVKVQRKSTEESVSEEHSHHDYDDNAFESPRHENDEGESKKKSSKRSLHLSKKHNSIDAVDGVHSEHQSSEPNEGHYTSSGFKRGSKKASLKKRSQVRTVKKLAILTNYI